MVTSWPLFATRQHGLYEGGERTEHKLVSMHHTSNFPLLTCPHLTCHQEMKLHREETQLRCVYFHCKNVFYLSSLWTSQMLLRPSSQSHQLGRNDWTKDRVASLCLKIRAGSVVTLSYNTAFKATIKQGPPEMIRLFSYSHISCTATADLVSDIHESLSYCADTKSGETATARNKHAFGFK